MKHVHHKHIYKKHIINKCIKTRKKKHIHTKHIPEICHKRRPNTPLRTDERTICSHQSTRQNRLWHTGVLPREQLLIEQTDVLSICRLQTARKNASFVILRKITNVQLPKWNREKRTESFGKTLLHVVSHGTRLPFQMTFDSW